MQRMNDQSQEVGLVDYLEENNHYPFYNSKTYIFFSYSSQNGWEFI